MNSEKDLLLLCRILARLIESRAGTPITPDNLWLNRAHILSKKYILHITTIITTCHGGGLILPDGNIATFIDHPSVHVLCRAAIETYIVFCYVFHCKDEALSKFRYETWVLAGLIDRQKYRAICPEALAKQLHEKEDILRLTSSIQSSCIFKNLDSKSQKLLLDGKWKAKNSWLDLAQMTNMSGAYFRNIYSYLSSSSHSSYSNVIQLEQALGLDDQRELAHVAIHICSLQTANFIHAYAELFDINPNDLTTNAPEGIVYRRCLIEPEQFDKLYQ